MKAMNRNQIIGGIIGAIVGDALGVPVEFESRKSLMENPVEDMREYGNFNQPRGTWSDDSSMILCTIDSLINGLDYEDMGRKFCTWLEDGYWTPYGEVFDIGRTTFNSILYMQSGRPALESGFDGEYDNGNGSLTRILPFAFYLYNFQYENREDIVIKASSITHSNEISTFTCYLYVEYAIALLEGLSKRQAYSKIQRLKGHGWKREGFRRIQHGDIGCFRVEDIYSSGYVIHSLEAALWCFITTTSYKECVLKAVNLGDDTNSLACIAGGLAGIFYGFNKIPPEWINSIARKNDIFQLCDKFLGKLKEKE